MRWVILLFCKKKWTVLIYANGNNELEPEIWQSKLDLEKVKDSSNLNIVLQIGREARKLVEIIRPYDNIMKTSDIWTGVRRYHFKSEKFVKIKDLGYENMADPFSLYNFLEWSINQYPAEKYMLIMGGHVYQFVGALTDYSQNKPYIMGLPEMSRIFQLVKERLNVVLDLLILDVCFFNFIEVLYEFGKYEKSGFKYLLTYIYDGPLAGLPYDQIINVLKKKVKLNEVQVIKNIVNEIDRELVAFDINYEKMKNVKSLFHKLAGKYLNIKDKERPGINKFINHVIPEKAWYKDVKKLHQELQSLIIFKSSNSNRNPINVAQNLSNDPEKNNLYQKLAFSKKNDWLKILTGERNQENSKVIKNKKDIIPTVLSSKAVKANIKAMNPFLNQDNLNQIYKNLIKYKKWKIF